MLTYFLAAILRRIAECKSPHRIGPVDAVGTFDQARDVIRHGTNIT